MTKGLKLLNKKRTSIPANECFCTTKETVKQIKKELKVLEIINRLFDKYDFELVNSYEDGEPVYVLRLGTQHKKWVFALVLTKKEYDLLQEVLS